MDMHETYAYQIAKAQNTAENGRCFCAMLFLLNLLTGHPLLALLVTLSVAAAILADMLPVNIGRRVSLAVYVYTAAIVLVSIVNLW